MLETNNFASKIIRHIEWLVRYNQGSSMLVQAAEQNVLHVMAAIVSYVANKESWGETDVTSWSTYEVAKQRLYLGHSILIDLVQKPMSHPDVSFVEFDTERYSKIFYDLELNASDPYFDSIKRNYYNEVSS